MTHFVVITSLTLGLCRLGLVRSPSNLLLVDFWCYVPKSRVKIMKGWLAFKDFDSRVPFAYCLIYIVHFRFLKHIERNITLPVKLQTSFMSISDVEPLHPSHC